MDVILVKEIKNKGKAGDSITVNRGYAMNFLIPKGFAIPATQASTQQFKELQKKEATRLAEEKVAAKELIGKVDGKTITLSAKADGDKLYGSVPPNSIAKQIKAELELTVTKDQVIIEAPIKMLGEHKIAIQLHPEISATLTVIVKAEEEAVIEEENTSASSQSEDEDNDADTEEAS